MAMTTTPLGFKKPDGNELVRGGDNAIADNAQKAQELFANAFGRLSQAEANIATGGGGSDSGLSEDPANPGMYFVAGGSPITEDPANPGYYLL